MTSIADITINESFSAGESYNCTIEYNNGSIILTIIDSDDNIIANASVTDTSPHPLGYVGFNGNIKDKPNEYIYIDNFKIQAFR
jgi:hypothetical protein